MTDAHADGEQPRMDRRRALRAAGAAALGVTMSDAVVRQGTAHAQTTGQPFLLGEVNTSTEATVLQVEPSGDSAPTHGLDIYADDSPYGIAVSGLVWGVSAYGLVGATFVGNNDFGAAVELYPRDEPGPPTQGDHYVGELVVDSNGRLWLCDHDEDGANPHWEQISHRGTRYLDLPQRAVARQALSAGETITVDLGTAISGVPAEATGVFGNLTILNPRNSGYITIYRDGSVRPNVANISWVQTNGYIANSFSTAVSNRRLSLFASQRVDVYLDIVGYVV